MRVCSVALVSLLILSSCSRQPGAPAAPAAQVQGSLNQVMRGILFPNSNVIFDAQNKDPGAPPDPADPGAVTNPYANLYGGWEAVENASVALFEAANLVQLPGRKCQNGKPVPLEEDTFRKGLAALRDTSLNAYKAAQSKDLTTLVAVADKLALACSTCHDVYRDRLVNGKPITMEQRCSAS
jgi:hypothetical protein